MDINVTTNDESMTARDKVKFVLEVYKDMDFTELDTLEMYLKCRDIEYKRYDCNEEFNEEGITFVLDRHQIVVGNGEWDAICQKGSFGYEEGLLEIMGEIVPDTIGDCVEGYLTAWEVIDRIEEYEAKDVLGGQ